MRHQSRLLGGTCIWGEAIFVGHGNYEILNYADMHIASTLVMLPNLMGHMQVAVNYMASAAGAEEVCKAIEASGGQASAFQADISDPAAVSKLLSDVVAEYGTLDVLVNNAGITKDTLMARMKPEQWQTVIDTNLSAVFYSIQVSIAALLSPSHAPLRSGHPGGKGERGKGGGGDAQGIVKHFQQQRPIICTILCSRSDLAQVLHKLLGKH